MSILHNSVCRRGVLCHVALFVLGISLAGCGSDAVGRRALADKMETVEETTESYANALLDLSVAARRYDLEEVALYFAPHVRSNGIPDDPSAPKAAGWVTKHSFAPSATVTELGREKLVAQLAELLERYREFEDVRFKVKSSIVTGDRVDSSLKFWIVGRNYDGHREWTKGRAEASGQRQGERWQLLSFVVTALDFIRENKDQPFFRYFPVTPPLRFRRPSMSYECDLAGMTQTALQWHVTRID